MMRSKFIFIIFILTFAGFVAVGCNQTKDEQAETTKQLEPGQTEDPNNDTSVEVADGEITAAVKSKLMTDENVAARRIDVDTEDGVVTLRGTVASPTEADRAVELAKMADGVRLVHSYLKTDISDTNTSDDISELGEQAQDALNEAGGAIETGVEQAEDLGSDAAITAQIKWKLAKDKLVQAADIDVDTKDRHVTLTGIVSNQQEAKRALQIAQSVEDVLAVDNNLRIR
jgi:hyperosmotically inducible periplasmic protein